MRRLRRLQFVDAARHLRLQRRRRRRLRGHSLLSGRRARRLERLGERGFRRARGSGRLRFQDASLLRERLVARGGERLGARLKRARRLGDVGGTALFRALQLVSASPLERRQRRGVFRREGRAFFLGGGDRGRERAVRLRELRGERLHARRRRRRLRFGFLELRLRRRQRRLRRREFGERRRGGGRRRFGGGEFLLQIGANRVERFDLAEHLLHHGLLLLERRLHARGVFLGERLRRLRRRSAVLRLGPRRLRRRRGFLGVRREALGRLATRLDRRDARLRSLAKRVALGGAFHRARGELALLDAKPPDVLELRRERRHATLRGMRVVLRLQLLHACAERLHLHADANNLGRTLRSFPERLHLLVPELPVVVAAAAAAAAALLERLVAQAEHHLRRLQIRVQAFRELLHGIQPGLQVRGPRRGRPRRRRRNAVRARDVLLQARDALARSGVLRAGGAAVGEARAQARDLGGELVLAPLRLLVGARLYLDHLGPLRELERGERLLHLPRRGRDARQERAPRAPAERILEQVGELRVAVRHVPLLAFGDVHQRLDDVAQRAEALVDGGRFLQARAASLGGLLPLRARQVHQVERRVALLKRRAGEGAPARLQRHGEHGVRARGLAVHLRLPDAPVERPAREQIVRLLRARHQRLGKTLHEHAAPVVLADLRRRARRGSAIGVGRRQQVRHLLVVNLEVRALHRERYVHGRGLALGNAHAALLVLHALEDALQHARNQTLRLGVIRRERIRVFGERHALGRALLEIIGGALHGEGLTRARLPVRDQAPVIPLQERVRHGYAHALEDLALGLVLVAHVVVPVRGGRLALDLDGLPVHEHALGVSLRRRGVVRRGEDVRD